MVSCWGVNDIFPSVIDLDTFLVTILYIFEIGIITNSPVPNDVLFFEFWRILLTRFVSTWPE